MPSRFARGYDVSTGGGAFYFFIPIMIHFILTINEILREKEKKLRLGITVMGMTHSAYWLSWFCTSICVGALITATLMFTGWLLRFDFFIKAPAIVNFSFLFVFDLSM